MLIHTIIETGKPATHASYPEVTGLSYTEALKFAGRTPGDMPQDVIAMSWLQGPVLVITMAFGDECHNFYVVDV